MRAQDRDPFDAIGAFGIHAACACVPVAELIGLLHEISRNVLAPILRPMPFRSWARER
jgi:hypothetical protein